MTGRSRESLTLDHSVIDGSASFTVAARVKIGDPSKPMVVARQGTSGNDTWRIEYRPVDASTSQWIFARTAATSSTETATAVSVDRSTVTDWHLISATYAVAPGGTVNPRLDIAVDLFDRSVHPFPATPTRAGATTIGSSRTQTTPFVGRLDDLRLYAGVAAEPFLCTTYLDPNNCG
ncbi:LamG domain-containing protein [Kribbella qitaiheensis]|uniref:LamG domain-containing protein n=1 Tax=Kribbella qitaiheensis TaxID=1544730 RepID=A0A7G6X886_9ACTN|nr:LamG-like jellyroll fold domain-containing protein [Kribbella qitaiheensis]QNE22451.1 LamG domain-containing protein [Kribbella qitaiheensis]